MATYPPPPPPLSALTHDQKMTARGSHASVARHTKPVHRYRGHRRDSFVTTDVDELVEHRARSRTISSYVRTTLANLGYALLILKIFTKEFARIGLLYVVLALLLLLISWNRQNRSIHDFSDEHLPPNARPSMIQKRSPASRQSSPVRPAPAHSSTEPTDQAPTAEPTTVEPSTIETARPLAAAAEPTPAPHGRRDLEPPISTTATSTTLSSRSSASVIRPRIWGRAFRTSGDVVILIGLVCTALYAAIFALVMKL